MTSNIKQLRTHLERMQGLARLIEVTAEDKFITTNISGKYGTAIQDAANVIDIIGSEAWNLLETVEKEIEALQNANSPAPEAA